MIIVDRLLVGGIGWVLRRVADAASSQLYDEGSLREELLAAEMKLELGEIDDAAFAQIERDVMERMREVRERKRSGAHEPPAPAMRYALDAIDVEIGQQDGKTETCESSPSLRALRR